MLLDAAAVVAACGPAAAVEAVTAALTAGLDPAADPPRQAVPLHTGQLLLMPSEAGRYAGVKVATVAPGNPGRGLPRVQASYLLFDADTLGLVAVLDGTALTSLRTPAVSVAAVASRLRAGVGPASVAVLGAGPQAHGHVATLAAVLAAHRPRRPLGEVTHLVRDPARVPPIHGATVVALDDPRAGDVLRAADVVVCATSARSPLFDAGLVAAGAVVIAVGSHEPDARELPGALLARSTVVVEDVATALREAGDVCLAVDEGAVRAADLVPMRDAVTGRVTPAPDRPLVFKSVGMAWQDLVVAEAVLRAHLIGR
ncbi:ornithine cyclodeaminase family protein [Dactylosporangium aurantiacum]|uniref:Ornithine cyclodeaminase family protein n=1 Tax=Dactylosporangium aurantiacum TaxID=35754 RepID=A0A9Q9IQ13_9ACTN|nr:ornithine cyclodeaminase family protein [Dactylosporangium aurantiacum]